MRESIAATVAVLLLSAGPLIPQPSSDAPSHLTSAYRGEAAQILGAALSDVEGWEKLTYLATVIGHRLSGSAGLEQAIDWAAETMQSEGLTVRKQPIMVPHWVRGNESASVVSPVRRRLPILGLGRSVGTPPGGITAPAVVVGSFEELEALGRDEVEGKIVVYAVPWMGYGRTVRYRSAGASRAAALGAVAALVRSATGVSIASPHTGALRYDEAQPQIPAAAITVEDAEWMRRMVDLGRPLSVHLEMEAHTLPDVESFNVIAEIPGRERPKEVVVMGGHYDSWDVGEGVHDDGAACVAAWQALRLIDQLGLRPRRTLRVVLWTNEENGLRGGRGYREALTDEEVANHVAAIEMDGGAERPVGFGFGLVGVDPRAEEPDPAYEAAIAKLEQIGSLLSAIDASEIRRGGGGADIGPLMRSGVPGLGLRTVGEHYFDWHHSHGDTLDKVDIEDFRRAIALLGVMGYVLADMPERLVTERVSGSTAGEADLEEEPLEGTYWKLVSLGGEPVELAQDTRGPHLVLDRESLQASGTGGCNLFSGGYRLEGEKLSFGRLRMTMMACREGMDVDSPLTAALDAAASYSVSKGRLELLGDEGAVLATFEAGEAERD